MQIAAARNLDLCAELFLTNAIGYDFWPIPSVKALRAAIIAPFICLGHDDQTIVSESVDVHWQNYAAYNAAPAYVRQIRSLNGHDTFAARDLGTPLQRNQAASILRRSG